MSTATKILGVVSALGVATWIFTSSRVDAESHTALAEKVVRRPDVTAPKAPAIAASIPPTPGPTSQGLSPKLGNPGVVTDTTTSPAPSAPAGNAGGSSSSVAPMVAGWPAPDAATAKTIDDVRALLANGKPEKALEAAEAALNADRNNEHLLLEVASLAGQVVGDKKKAEALLTELVEKHPESKMGAAAMGDFLTTQGRFAEATPHLRRAATGDAPAEAHQQLGYNLMNQRDFGAAATSFGQAYRKAQEELTEKRARGDSTLFPAQKAGNLAVDEGFALLESGRPDEAARRVRDARSLLGPDNERAALLTKALEQRPPQPNPAP